MSARCRLLFPLVIAFTPLAAERSLADTLVSGNITTNTTWTLAASPYVVTGDVAVWNNATLTLQAGVVVKFNAGKRLWLGYGGTGTGNLKVNGTSASPVDFTANTATPTAGFWAGIVFWSGATSASNITYATIHWAGDPVNSRGSVHVQGPAPTLQNVTVRDGLFAAVSVSGGSVTLNSSTLTTHPIGLWMSSYNSSASFSTVTISNNTGFAMSFDPRITLGTITSVTATGNGTNGIEIRGAVADLDRTATWKKVGSLPYVVTGSVYVKGSPTPVLTVAAGVTVKFNAGLVLSVGAGTAGELQAVGTNSSQIDFTANTTSPTLGFWLGIQFGGQAVSTSKLAYSKVRYAGSAGGAGGVDIQYSSPVFDHVTFDSNAFAGVRVFSSSPTVQKCNFINNTAGLINSTPSSGTVSAKLNWWGNATGPSGSGPGAGQSVSNGAVFEPWLTATESHPQFFTSAIQLDRTFNPSIGNNTQITLGTQQSGNWTVKFINGSAQVVRTFTGTGTSATVSWDGKNTGGVDQLDGPYSYQLESTAGANSASPAKGVAIIDRTKQLTITGVAVSQAFFSPNADGVQDTTTFSATLNFDGAAWTLQVKNSVNFVVRTATGPGPTVSFAWDGKDGGGVVQADGVYTFALSVTVGTASASASATTTLDKTLPVSTVTAPTSGQTLSNVYQSAATLINVVGSASDANINNWQLDCVGCYINVIAVGTTSFTNATLGSWETLPLTNTSYTIRLQVWDKAGNYKTVSVPVTVGNFKMTQSALQISAPAGNTVTYTSTVPFALTQTIMIKNEAGQTVRTLVNAASRAAGTFNDSWDGRTSGGALLPDGGYFYVATATAGSSTMTWDLSSVYLSDSDEFGETLSTFDPFNNVPMAISYNFSRPGMLYIAFRVGPGSQIPYLCPPPDFCIVCGRYEEGGPHVYYWAGVDSTGRYRPDAHAVAVVSLHSNMSSNAVVVFGTRPSVTGVTSTPGFYAPNVGSQTIAYTFATYLSQTATVTIKFLNQSSLSTLRTITLPAQSSGAHTTVWDGKADNGMWVAPGTYLVTVAVTDAIGNQGVGQMMMTVQY